MNIKQNHILLFIVCIIVGAIVWKINNGLNELIDVKKNDIDKSISKLSNNKETDNKETDNNLGTYELYIGKHQHMKTHPNKYGNERKPIEPLQVNENMNISDNLLQNEPVGILNNIVDDYSEFMKDDIILNSEVLGNRVLNNEEDNINIRDIVNTSESCVNNNIKHTGCHNCAVKKCEFKAPVSDRYYSGKSVA